MAKRVRGSRSTHKPGGQGPSRTRTSSSTPDAARDPIEGEVLEADVTVDIDGAMDSVAMQGTEIAIEETIVTPTPRRRNRRGAKAKTESLEARASGENVYVRQDLRRIGVISGSLLAALLIAWLVTVPLNLLGFY